MEHVDQYRRTENEAHLIFGQAGAQLRNHFLGQNVSLLYIDPILGNDMRDFGASR
jgi:hypothetical protein